MYEIISKRLLNSHEIYQMEVLYQLTFAFTRRFFPAGEMKSDAYWSSLASMASISTSPSRAIISPLSQSIRSVFGIPERA